MSRFLLFLVIGVYLVALRASRAEDAHTQTGSEEEAVHNGESSECQLEEDEGLDSKVRIAGLRFNHLMLLLVVVAFILIVVIAKLIWHHDFMQLISSNIPESCMLIVVGAHVGGIIESFFLLDRCDSPIDFTPNLFFLVLLPPIVLEAGYFMDNRRFFENFLSINFYAFVGTIWNAFALGLIIYGLGQAGLLLPDLPLSLSASLLFGTICAAVDPVAVLAVFEEIHVEKVLYILVFGESLLNDAVTVVLFNLLGAFSNREVDPELNVTERSIGVDDVFLGIGQFVVVILASVIIGVLIGLLASFITRFTEHVHVLEPMVVFAMGYLSYLLADLFEFSGILSIIACAIAMKHYVQANVSQKSRTTINYSMKVLSNLSEMVIFLFLGISLFDVSVHYWDTGLVLWTILLALLIRPVGVILQSLVLNCFRVKKISKKSMFVMSYSGLRGAVAFSLALTRIYESPILVNATVSPLVDEYNRRRAMLSAVTTLVLFTVFVQGTTIKPLVLRVLKVDTVHKHTTTMSESFNSTAVDHITSGVEEIIGHFGHHRLRELLQFLDVKVFRKIFERYPEAMDEHILHTFTKLQYQDTKVAVEKSMSVSVEDLADQICKPKGGAEHEVEDQVEVPELNDVLNDVLNKSRQNPNALHIRHALPRTASDHRFEPATCARIWVEKTAKKRQKRINKNKRSQRQSPGIASPQVYNKLGGNEEGNPVYAEEQEAIEIDGEDESKRETIV